MAWISIHEQLKDHRKLRNLARLLNCSKHEAVGVLIILWLWGINNADRDGNLGNATADDIADGAMYHALCAAQFVNCLINSGWLEEKDGQYILHDWDYWQEQWYKAVDKRKANSQRMKAARAREKQECAMHSAMHGARSVQPHVQASPSPNRQTNNTPIAPKGARRRKQYSEEPAGFQTFWTLYPKKVDKAGAIQAWIKLNPDEGTQSAIIAGLNKAVASRQWREDEGQYIPNR